MLRERATVIQQKTGRPVPFEITDSTREALAAWLKLRGARRNDWLFLRRSRPGHHIGTKQYGRLVDKWAAMIDLEPRAYGTHSLRQTKVAMLYKKTGNLRACQLLLGHRKFESTARYLGIEVDDALELSQQVNLCDRTSFRNAVGADGRYGWSWASTLTKARSAGRLTRGCHGSIAARQAGNVSPAF